MRAKLLKNRQILKNLSVVKDRIYEVLDIVEGKCKILVPGVRKGNFYNVLVADDEIELID